MLDNKADVNASLAIEGATPLYVAAQNGYTKIVKLLLDNKADVNASRYTNGATPLYAAAWNGHTEVVKQLLDNKVDVNASRTDDDKPIDVARRKHYVEIL